MSTIKNLINLLYNLQSNFYAKYLLAIFAIVGGYSALVVFDNYSNHQHKTFCFFKLATGIPCPGCGMGRATLEIMKGDIVSSFKYNLLCIPFTFAIIVSLAWLFIDVLHGKETFFPFINSKIKLSYAIILFSLIVISWIINIIRQM